MDKKSYISAVSTQKEFFSASDVKLPSCRTVTLPETHCSTSLSVSDKVQFLFFVFLTVSFFSFAILSLSIVVWVNYGKVHVQFAWNLCKLDWVTVFTRVITVNFAFIGMCVIYWSLRWIKSYHCFCVTCCKQRWHLGITSPSVRPSIRPSVPLFPSKRNNSSSTDAIEMKLHMWIELKRVKSHAQDP